MGDGRYRALHYLIAKGVSISISALFPKGHYCGDGDQPGKTVEVAGAASEDQQLVVD